MNGASEAVVMTPQKVVEPPPAKAVESTKAAAGKEAPKPKTGKEANLQFAQIIEMAVNSNNIGPEALAAIAGWGILGRVDGQLNRRQGQVMELLKGKKITEEKAVELTKKIGETIRQAHESIIPVLKNLDQAVRQEGSQSVLSPFMRDLNYHHIKYDIKRLEGSSDPNDQLELLQLKKDLVKAEQSREKIKPEDDETVKFALNLRGEKGLPEKFKDSPLEAIDDFFQHKLGHIVRSEKARAQMAKRLGVAPEDLTNLVAVYNRGSAIDRQVSAIDGEINPKKTNKLAMVGGMMGLFMALQTWLAMKKESSGGQQPG